MSYSVEIRVDSYSGNTINEVLIPHTFLVVVDPIGVEKGYGFAPHQTGLFGEGVVHDDTNHPYDASSGKIDITQAQYDQLMAYINQPPPPYALPFGAQCTTWALQGLADSGIIPSILAPNMLPNPFFFLDILETIAFNPFTQKIGFDIYKAISDLLGTLPDPLVKTIKYVKYVDPLILDLDGDGLEITPLNKGVLFDANGDAIKTGTAWVGADDGLLVWDRNGNGLVDSGRELFGDETVLANGQKAANGFAALNELDSNHDGKFDNIDSQYATLRIWRDLNQDGISQANELKTLADSGVQSISLTNNAINIRYPDAQLVQSGSFTRTDASTGQVGSFILAQNNFVRSFTPIPVNDAVWRMAA